MNSREGQKENISVKISFIYFNQIEAFYVSIMGGGAEKFITFAFTGKIFQMHFYLSLLNRNPIDR